MPVPMRSLPDWSSDHLSNGGIVLAATHQPLGLAKAMELKMTGFSYAEEEFAA